MPRLHFANCANPRVLVTGISLAGGQIPPDYFSVGRRLFIEWSGFRKPFHSNGINYIARRGVNEKRLFKRRKKTRLPVFCARKLIGERKGKGILSCYASQMNEVDTGELFNFVGESFRGGYEKATLNMRLYIVNIIFVS